jgi:zinc finger protein
LTAKEPVALSVKIGSIEDLNIRVIKSGTATVCIPEFGATITPGPYSEGYISNVEGVLGKIEHALTFMLSSAKGKKLLRGERMLKKIGTAREHRPNFTFVLKDPFGNSALVSSKTGKVKKRTLTKNELLKIRFGEHALIQRTAHQ